MTVYWKATRCACGCGREVRPKTPGRNARYVHGHNPVPARRIPLQDRFWSRVDRTGQCWLWTGGADPDGRGRVWYQGRNIPAPRAALLIAGVDVPLGAMVCHHCDVPACVRPDHLYVGDALSNVRDMDARGRRVARVPHPGASGERNHNVKLTDEEVLEVRARYTGRRGEQSRLARDFGVTPQLIGMIVRGLHRV